MRGAYRDVLISGDGHVQYASGWKSNTVVDTGRALLAGFLKNDTSSGIQYLAVGQGLTQWDVDGTPVPDPASIDLLDRYSATIPVGSLNIVYLDTAGNVVDGPTMQLEITATLEAGYPIITPPAVAYPLREFGLFGKFDGVDYMLNCVRHPVINKDAYSTLIRVMRLYL